MMIQDVSPKQVWDVLRSDPQARLVDVRTPAEWAYVGVPEAGENAAEPVLIPWQIAPAMQVNAEFVDQLKQAGVTPEHHVYFLCRSGVRSMAAAQAAQAAGFLHAYNVSDGFEGPPDAAGQRGHVAGWQAEGLPWRAG